MRVYEKIVARLRREIAKSYRSGDQLPPIRQLARRFKVGTTAIHQSLAVLSHEGLVEKRHGSGVYVCDRSAQRHVAVLLQLDFAAPGLSNFWRRVTQQLRTELRQQGFPVRIYLGSNPPGKPEVIPCEEFLADIAEDKIAGVAVAFGWRDPVWFNSLQQRGVPVVGSADVFECGVRADGAEWIRQATLRLLASGRRRIGLMRWCPEVAPRGTDSQLEVFTTTLAAHGACYRGEWVRGDIHPSFAGAGWEEFREIWSAAPEKPDGLIVFDDMLLQSAFPAMLELGVRIPEQLSIVAHVAKGTAHAFPRPVRCSETDPDEYARVLADLLARQLRGERLLTPQVTLPIRWVDDAPAHAAPARFKVSQFVKADQ